MSAEQKQPTISVITATYNAAPQLSKLMESLRQQSDRDFEWVVADGASSDGTVELLKTVSDLNVVVSSQPDFGVYDALNRAVSMASGDYYIVSGADDVFSPDAIRNFKQAITSSGADMIVAGATYGSGEMQVKPLPAWVVGHAAYIASHVLATAIKRSLHERFGLYSRKYPLAADQLFVMRVCENGASRHRADFKAGDIGTAGISSVDRVGCATELFRVQLELEKSAVLQWLMLLLRLTRACLAR